MPLRPPAISMSEFAAMALSRFSKVSVNTFPVRNARVSFTISEINPRAMASCSPKSRGSAFGQVIGRRTTRAWSTIEVYRYGVVRIDMIPRTHSIIAAASLLVFALLASDPAYAFRCKSKIVRDGMHEQQVIAVCGQPTSVRHIGYALRGYAIGLHNRYPGGLNTG